MQYRAFEPDIEIYGAAMLATVGGFGPLRAIVERTLLRHGLIDTGRPDTSDAWYPQQSWLDALLEVDKRFGTQILFNIGAEIPNNAVFPASAVDVHTAVQSIDLAYHLNHRRAGRVMYDAATQTMLEGIGHYGYDRLGPSHILSTCETPYPCEFDFGIVATMVRRFEPRAIATHMGSECRRQGAQACTYSLRWDV
ncbi:hypothetical protein DB30_07160 [Enhygromyxa salina]|uniref:4-vinyl reductase 4VR domain-containing protein n=1 Tax=Enhygromyxa salina TaxID=215803 RepID=A0A0C1ZMZ6_9BACT|nr:hypothetical protein [Enhygromyxa salina]KIG18824.1 hypothetical protein DB30_07160 [Enhygromyxa salina]